jgi:hypothetical protein
LGKSDIEVKKVFCREMSERTLVPGISFQREINQPDALEKNYNE